MTDRKARGPLISEAKRDGGWEPAGVEAHANVGTLRSLRELGYTHIRIAGGVVEHDITALLTQLRGGNSNGQG